ncbi:hypothetical protein AMECASPLE_033787 [Ameca splendens]|uniref:Uncharacterized protein n=1 Tax=Ameca splendens TaxID=208324 RepID=A0ABV0YU08_9TELE
MFGDGCTVEQLVGLLPCSKKVLGSTPSWGSFFVFSPWGLPRYSSFLPQSKNMTVRLFGLSKLPLGMNECVYSCLSCVCVSVLPCDVLVTCPGTSFPATHYGGSGRK